MTATSIGRHGRKHGLVAVVIAGGCEDALFPLCKKKASPESAQESEFDEHHEAVAGEGTGEPQTEESGQSGESDEILIPVANSPLLLYPLLLLEDLFSPSGLRSVAIACTTEDEARAVRHWVHQKYGSQPSRPHVIAINDHSPKDGAQIASLAFRQGLGAEFDLAENVIVMRGNLVSDVQLEAVVASHRLRNATATVMLARPRDELVNLTSGKKGAKTVVQKPSKSKAPKTFVGLGEGGCAGEGGRLCLWVSEASLNGGAALPNGKRAEVKQLQLPRRVMRQCGRVSISCNLIDTGLAVFSRAVFEGALGAEISKSGESGLGSVSGDLIPHLVKRQFVEGEASREAKEAAPRAGAREDNGDVPEAEGSSLDNEAEAEVDASVRVEGSEGNEGEREVVSLELTAKKQQQGGGGASEAVLSFDKLQEAIAEMTHGDFAPSVASAVEGGHVGGSSTLCSVYLAPPEKYCAIVNTIESYGEVSRDLTSAEFSQLLPPTTMHCPPQEVGSKTTVGAGCLFGDGVRIGDKCR